MKQKSLLIAAALAGVSLTTAAFAYPSKDATNPPPLPRVIAASVVSPTGLPREFEGEIVNVEFRLDRTGQPREIDVLWVHDDVLKKRLVDAFRQWRFELPATGAHNASQRFILPIQLKPEV